MRVRLFLLLIMGVLLAGCAGSDTTSEVQFTCPSGDVVSDRDLCQKGEPPQSVYGMGGEIEKETPTPATQSPATTPPPITTSPATQPPTTAPPTTTPPPTQSYACDSDYYNCGDFETHAKAQEVFEFCGGIEKDIHRLDVNNDGIACENLPNSINAESERDSSVSSSNY